MEKLNFRNTMSFLYVIYFRNKQNICISLFGFDRNFDHPDTVNVVTFVPIIQSKKPQFFHNAEVFCWSNLR